LVQAFLRAFNAGDIDALMALYEPHAILVAQSGELAQGHAALREGFDAFLRFKPILTLEQYTLIPNGDLTLFVDKWTLQGTGPDGQPVHMAGTPTDVFRQQTDGRWLFAIDNPWGAGLLH
jgi:ketosteroid isomerase-like protein